MSNRHQEPDPSNPLAESMMGRAGDLAHWMLRNGIPIAVANGTTPNGHPCTVIYAIGEQAEPVAKLGERLVDAIERRQRDDRIEREKN